MLTKLIAVIISQCIHTSNHYVVHLGLIQCYMSIITQKNWKKIKKIKKGTKVTIFIIPKWGLPFQT